MDSKHCKANAKILTRRNAARRKDLHLKYIALKNRRMNRSEPTLTKNEEITEFHKSNLEKIKKTHVLVDRHAKKNAPQELRKNLDSIEKPTGVKKNPIAQRVQNPITKLKAKDKLKVVAAKPGMKRALTKSRQKIKTSTELGGFTKKVVSMWHYARSFFGLSNSERQNTPKCSINNKRSKQNLPINIKSVKPKRAIYAVKTPLLFHNTKDSKELKNILNIRPEQKFTNRKIIADAIKIPAVLPILEVNKLNPNNDIICKNEVKNNKIEGVRQIELKDKPKDVMKTKPFTYKYLQYENTKQIVESNEKKQIEPGKQILTIDKPKKDITLEINSNRPLCEILNKENDTNTTIIIEIKNAFDTASKDNVNHPIQTLDVHKNTEKGDKNIITLLNPSNVKQNITQLKTRNLRKAPTNNGEKSLPKITKKIQCNLDKNKQACHENNKRRVRHKQHISSKRHHYKTYSHKHGCRHHNMKRTNPEVFDCRGHTISSDDSQQGKAYDDRNKELCHICKRRVTCLYHHNKKNHKYNRSHQDKKAMRPKHGKKPESSKKHSPPKKNKSVHHVQKKKRTWTVCTNSRRNSFKNKKIKRSLTYIPMQTKPSILKVFPKFKYSSTNTSYIDFQRLNSSLFRTDTDSDSDSDEQEIAKVLSWWYLHYAFNSVRPNADKLSHQSETEDNKPFTIPYGDFRNVYEAISKVNIDSDDSSSDGNWSEETNDFPKHPNSFTEEIILPEDIYPDSSLYSSIRNFEGYKINDTRSNTSMNTSLPNYTPEKSTIDLQTEESEFYYKMNPRI